MLAFWHSVIEGFSWLPPWVTATVIFVAILAGGLLLQGISMKLLQGASQNWSPLLRLVFLRTNRVGRFAVFVFAVAVALPIVPMSQHMQDVGHHVLVALFILLVGWIVLDATNIAMERYMGRLRLDTSDNLLARKAITQMRVLGQVLDVLIGVLTIGFALMTFDSVRQFGISLFASAGLAGIAVGLAARPLLSNLIAGIQLAITQPIRIDDAVVINNEWGWVEEFTSTFVVIRLWDLRRLIVPLSYFFENPFANWTRSGSTVIGTVLLYLDYSVPVDRVRAKAIEFAKASKNWDGNVINVQVTDAKEHTIEVRIIASAADSSKAFDLRCELREKLIGYVQREFPNALPRLRGELEPQSPALVRTRPIRGRNSGSLQTSDPTA
jgi:small-conductance mechanosensitive channel